MPLDPSIKAGIVAQIPKTIKPEVEKQFKQAFESIKNRMVLDFLNHPITQEIKAGPNSSF